MKGNFVVKVLAPYSTYLFLVQGVEEKDIRPTLQPVYAKATGKRNSEVAVLYESFEDWNKANCEFNAGWIDTITPVSSLDEPAILLYRKDG